MPGAKVDENLLNRSGKDLLVMVLVIYSKYRLKFVCLYDLYFLGKTKYPADIEFFKVPSLNKLLDLS